MENQSRKDEPMPWKSTNSGDSPEKKCKMLIIWDITEVCNHMVNNDVYA